MSHLPLEFINYTREIMGDERFGRYMESFNEAIPVSIRLNPLKTKGMMVAGNNDNVPWCRDGYYLSQRPVFTFDPLLHAGCYYVQEAASMFLDTVLRQHLPHHPVTMLDLCAAPGGKSTLARAVLPEGSVLYANEPVPGRANILAENIQKWGYADCIVTNNRPADYRKSKLMFDIILCDVPCSGEGMFRKDEATIREWSVQNVEQCWKLQRSIVSDAWACLNDGGLLIYSTCTFNLKENEENIRWIISEFDATLLPVATKPEWNITGSLLPGFTQPVYRFIPGISKGEGLFMAVLKKRGECPDPAPLLSSHREKKVPLPLPLKGMEKGRQPQEGRSISAGLPPKGRKNVVAPLAVSGDAGETVVSLSYSKAMDYLRGEALVLPPDAPRGLIEVSFMGFPLGMVKNIGNRANNLYPKTWRIKTTHIPNNYEAILRPA